MSDEERLRRTAIARSLCARICDERRTIDELRVLDRILTRISGGGAEQYGGMVLATDKRDFRAEAADEFADALWYMAADVVRREDEKLERLRCEAADELAAKDPVAFGLQELAKFGVDAVKKTIEEEREAYRFFSALPSPRPPAPIEARGFSPVEVENHLLQWQLCPHDILARDCKEHAHWCDPKAPPPLPPAPVIDEERRIGGPLSSDPDEAALDDPDLFAAQADTPPEGFVVSEIDEPPPPRFFDLCGACGLSRAASVHKDGLTGGHPFERELPF